MAHENDTIGPNFFFFRQKAPSKHGRHFQGRDQIGLDSCGRDSLWLANACQVECCILRSRQLLEDRLLLLPILKVWNRNSNLSQAAPRISLPKANEAIRFFVREWLQEHCIDNTENRSIRSNTERQRNHDRQREARILPQDSHAVSRVLQERLENAENSLHCLPPEVEWLEACTKSPKIPPTAVGGSFKCFLPEN